MNTVLCKIDTDSDPQDKVGAPPRGFGRTKEHDRYFT